MNIILVVDETNPKLTSFVLAEFRRQGHQAVTWNNYDPSQPVDLFFLAGDFPAIYQKVLWGTDAYVYHGSDPTSALVNIQGRRRLETEVKEAIQLTVEDLITKHFSPGDRNKSNSKPNSKGRKKPSKGRDKHIYGEDQGTLW